MKISELSNEQKENLLSQAADLMRDYFSVKNRPEQVKNLFNREIAKELSGLIS
jgi:hypothetical protein